MFGPGFDGRKEDSFEPAETTQFTHGSALSKLSGPKTAARKLTKGLEINVVTSFICTEIVVKSTLHEG